MTGKRKRGKTAINVPQPNKIRQKLSLLDLPIEILDRILAHVIPDVSAVDAAFDLLSTAKMFAAPILQCSSFLRQQGFGIINRRVIWIRVQSNSRTEQYRIAEMAANLPLVPFALRYLIGDCAPMISLEIHNREDEYNEHERKSFLTGHSDKDAVVIPFNLVTSLRICSAMELSCFYSQVTIKYENMSSWSWQELEWKVMPALSELPYFDSRKYVPDISRCCPEKVPGFVCDWDCDLSTILKKTTDMLIHVDSLECRGYLDEAAILLMHYNYMRENAGYHLSAPRKWVTGMLDPDGFSTLPCPTRNKLRSQLFQIEHRSCLAYTRLLNVYGFEWCERIPGNSLDNSSSAPYDRYFDEPNFTWFGLSEAEQAQLHYGRARLSETFEALSNGDDDDDDDDDLELYFTHTMCSPFGTRNETLRLAFGNIFMAYHLQPDNDEYKMRYLELRRYMGERLARRLEPKLAKRFVVKRVPSKKVGDPDIVWKGDAEMLRRWSSLIKIDDDDLLQHLPRVRELPDETETNDATAENAAAQVCQLHR